MKKTLCALLTLCLFMSAAGCSPKYEDVEVEKTSPGVSKVWVASDEGVTHATGGLAVDDGWGAVVSNAPVRGTLAGVTLENMKPSSYVFAARLLTSGWNESDRTVAGLLRAVASDGITLGEQVVRVNDFTADLTYKEFSIMFENPKTDNVKLEIYWPGYSYVRVSEFGYMSDSRPESVPDFYAAPKAALGADTQESVTYDADALYVFDLKKYMDAAATSEDAYDVANLVATLQGLVNRQTPHLFIRFKESSDFAQDVDGYWLDKLTGGETEWAADFLQAKELVTVNSPMTLLKLFSNSFAGYAAWDEAVPATVNAAATACGADNLLPLRYSPVKNSIYHYLSNYDFGGGAKPVAVNLGGKFTGSGKIYETDLDSTGSRKNDAVLWTKVKYMDAGKTNTHIMAYHVDAYAPDTVAAEYADLQNMYLSNKDYYIANKAFFFDLSPMAFEIPDDDPDQKDRDGNADGSIDYNTLCTVMKKQNQIAHAASPGTPIDVGGFTPWHLKYTRYTNPSASGEVSVEWETVNVFSLFHAYINADAPHLVALANASVYDKYPAQGSYEQPGSKENSLTAQLPSGGEKGKNYLIFYVGDFDSSAWLNTAMIKLWNDPARGQLPLCWSFSTDIAKRAPHVVDMMYKTAGSNDYFVAGDNGVGYLNLESYYSNRRQGEALAGLNGTLQDWSNYNKTQLTKYGMDILGFLITTSASSNQELLSNITNAAASYAPVGMAINRSVPSGLNLVNDGATGVVRQIDAGGSVSSTVAAIKGACSQKENGSQSSFLSVRYILRAPSEMKAVYEELTSSANSGYNFELIDPYTFYKLHKIQNQGG
jgi:hypothetical protein